MSAAPEMAPDPPQTPKSRGDAPLGEGTCLFHGFLGVGGLRSIIVLAGTGLVGVLAEGLGWGLERGDWGAEIGEGGIGGPGIGREGFRKG